MVVHVVCTPSVGLISLAMSVITVTTMVSIPGRRTIPKSLSDATGGVISDEAVARSILDLV